MPKIRLNKQIRTEYEVQRIRTDFYDKEIIFNFIEAHYKIGRRPVYHILTGTKQYEKYPLTNPEWILKASILSPRAMYSIALNDAQKSVLRSIFYQKYTQAEENHNIYREKRENIEDMIESLAYDFCISIAYCEFILGKYDKPWYASNETKKKNWRWAKQLCEEVGKQTWTHPKKIPPVSSISSRFKETRGNGSRRKKKGELEM